ncbi:unnamed protein product [Rotaria sp. Silwood1]|nr:unnamed protein product [Rotaria sp. Silwood1]
MFGGVLIAVHKSIRSQRVDEFDNLCNLIVLEVGSDLDMFQLATCYSPPTEPIPLDIFDRLLQRNPNSIFTGDFNAKHNSCSRSADNQTGRALFRWLSSSPIHSSLEIINKYISTSTRSNATIDLIVAPSHMSSTSFSVLPSIGNDHHPVLWHPSFKISSTHHRFPIKCTRVPQGSCIGLALFIIYHHDILQALPTIHWKHLFADDLAILFSPSPSMSSSNMINALANQIKHVLLHLIYYSIKWKQPVNFSKTCWILFNRQVVPQIPNTICNGHNIEHVKKFKYLGTILDAKLSFTAHIDYIKTKIRTNMHIFKRLNSSRMMTEQVNYRLYNAFIRPYLQSILNIYPNLTPSKQNQLEGLNRKIFRVMQQWFDATNIEIENLPKYQSISKLTFKHWDKLIHTIL